MDVSSAKQSVGNFMFAFLLDNKVERRRGVQNILPFNLIEDDHT